MHGLHLAREYDSNGRVYHLVVRACRLLGQYLHGRFGKDGRNGGLASYLLSLKLKTLPAGRLLDLVYVFLALGSAAWCLHQKQLLV